MKGSPANLLPERGEALLYPGFFAGPEAEILFRRLEKEVPWRQEAIRIFGRSVNQPRLISWFADPGAAYGYSGIRLEAAAWTPLLLEIKARVEEAAGTTFNGLLLNYYRGGQDSMGWHRDNEPELGPHPVIASVSFGAPRRFLLRRVGQKDQKVEVSLGEGSLLLMRGESQTAWEHSVPKTAKAFGPRVNLTFRKILRETSGAGVVVE